MALQDGMGYLQRIIVAIPRAKLDSTPLKKKQINFQFPPVREMSYLLLSLPSTTKRTKVGPEAKRQKAGSAHCPLPTSVKQGTKKKAIPGDWRARLVLLGLDEALRVPHGLPPLPVAGPLSDPHPDPVVAVVNEEGVLEKDG